MSIIFTSFLISLLAVLLRGPAFFLSTYSNILLAGILSSDNSNVHSIIQHIKLTQLMPKNLSITFPKLTQTLNDLWLTCIVFQNYLFYCFWKFKLSNFGTLSASRLSDQRSVRPNECWTELSLDSGQAFADHCQRWFCGRNQPPKSKKKIQLQFQKKKKKVNKHFVVIEITSFRSYSVKNLEVTT